MMISKVIRCTCGDFNWVELATFFTVLIGGAFALWHWIRLCCVSRAEHLNAILERYGSKMMADLFYRLVSNATYGGEDSEVFYLGSLRFQDIKGENPENDIREDDIDSMLLLFAQICHEHERGTISKTEFAFFSYQIRRTLAHKQFKQYLFDFAEYCGKYKIGYPYLSLAREGLNVDALHYDKVLSFVDKKRIKFQNKLKDVLP